MFNLEVDGKAVQVSNVIKSSHGFSEVFVNNNSTRYLLPTLDLSRNVSFTTGGNKFKVSQL